MAKKIIYELIVSSEEEQQRLVEELRSVAGIEPVRIEEIPNK